MDNAQLIGGVWLPGHETHLVEHMTERRPHIEEGRATYQWDKIQAAVGHCPRTRRRVALDVGAHVGLWAMWLVRAFGHVHCFEPDPSHGDLLRLNMDRTNYRLFQTALGDRDGRAVLQSFRGESGRTHVMPCQAGAVEVRTLDSYAIERVDLIKIDVEGFELPVILGGEQTIREQRPVMVVEQKGNEAGNYGRARGEAVAQLQRWGARIHRVMSGDVILDWPP